MIVGLALKNMRSHLGRTIATVLAVAVAVAMFFCVFSFKQAVYDYIYAVETADCGEYDVLIKTSSNSDRITVVEPLSDLQGVESFSASLSLYAMIGDEYVKLRGFDSDKLEALNRITIHESSGNISDNTDNVAISRTMADKFGLSAGSLFKVSLGGREVSFCVSIIAENEGYFLNDSPYTVVGFNAGGVSRLIAGAGVAVYNEIYVKTAPDVNRDELIKKISEMPAYSEMNVGASVNTEYIRSQADSMSAPIVVSGLAVVVLAFSLVVLIFLTGVAEKRAYISRLGVVGASKKQLFGIFFSESFLLAMLGAVAGSLLAAGVFFGLLELTLGSSVVFGVSGLKLFGAAALGFSAALIASLYPLFRAFGSTVQENLRSENKKSPLSAIFAGSAVALTTVSLIVEHTLPGAKGALSLVNVILLLVSLAALAPYALRFIGRISFATRVPPLKLASAAVCRDRHCSRSVQMLTVGAAVSMVLFTAWSLTTGIFGGYMKDFENIVLVTNVRSDVDASEFLRVDGVKKAVTAVWGKADLQGKGFSRSVNLIGSSEITDLLEFGFVTDRETVAERLSEGDYIVLDKAMSELYGVAEGDTVSLTFNKIRKDLRVGGILSGKLFAGAYAILSAETVSRLFGAEADTVLAVTEGDPHLAASAIRAEFAGRNYYAVEALEAFRWETQSLNSVFDLVGTLAFVLTALVLAFLIFGAIASRPAAERGRSALLAAGASKNTLLASELAQYGITSLVSFVAAFAASVLITMSLTGALRLFGLYFDFVYGAGAAAAAGAALCAAYFVLPLALGFRKSYSMKRK